MALAAVALIAGGNAFAYDFEVDGVCYNILSETDRTVEIANGVSLCPDGVENASIDIPYSVAYGDQTYLIIGIGENAFSGCYKAKEVHLHENISYIKENAFKGCYYLSRIYCYAAPPTVSESSFDASIVTSSTNVYVVREYLDLYQNDPIWSKFWVVEFSGGESIFQIGNVYYKTINGIRDEGNEVKVYAICDDEYGYTPQTVEIPGEVT